MKLAIVLFALVVALCEATDFSDGDVHSANSYQHHEGGHYAYNVRVHHPSYAGGDKHHVFKKDDGIQEQYISVGHGHQYGYDDGEY